MIVNCEECGKRYQIDPDKIQGRQARFTCKGCGHMVTVSTPTKAPGPEPTRRIEPSAEMPEVKKRKKSKETKKEKGGGKAAVPKRLGLRFKMILLFFLVPILCIAAAGWLYIQQLNRLSSLINEESARVVNQLAEQTIGEIARSVADECAVYLKTHPGLPETRFNEDPEFREIAVQKVGKTGYTALYELPGADKIWRTWAHENPGIIGIDMSTLKGPLGKSFPGFWKVYAGVSEGKESKGYYTWQDKDKQFRDKFMVCTHVKGTPYIIAATTYIHEFTQPVKELASEAAVQTKRTRNVLLAIVIGTIVLIGALVSFYGHRLTQRIRYLTDAAERISVGELEMDIETPSNDEIGDLGEAISRMQDSIRLSIERLRRRR